MRKKIIIYRHNGGRLANQLWNFISIYAYCLEKGYECRNYSFFQYSEFFTIRAKNMFIDFFFFSGSGIFPLDRKNALYGFYMKIIQKFFGKQIISDDKINVFYLPPSLNQDVVQTKELLNLEKNDRTKWYFKGWLFRNPVGIKKYQEEIREYFKPAPEIEKEVSVFMSGLRRSYDHLVGVHIRGGDYRTWQNGQYYFEQKDVRKFLDSYCAYFKLEAHRTMFVLCSDAPIETAAFNSLPVAVSNHGPVGDLFTLAKSDIIIGSDSTYGAFAAYYGNIPLAVFNRQGIDWNKIKRDGGYNEDNACTWVNY